MPHAPVSLARIDRHRLRLASAIHAQLARSETTIPQVIFPQSTWQEAARCDRMLRKAAACGYRAAAQAMQLRLAQTLERLAHEAALAAQQARPPERPPRKPTLREIVEELAALDDEFDTAQYNPKTGTLSVTTAPIELEDVSLGRFEIRLLIRALREESPFRVIALDPHPAAGRSETVHPHVSGEVLCTGDGKRPLAQALAQGRLVDVFQILERILQTYNPGSAYRTLDDWTGTQCIACGDIVPFEETFECERCRTDLCLDCRQECRSCQRTLCHDCATSCAQCDDDYCPECLSKCIACEEPFCENCRHEGLCAACADAPAESDEGSDVPAVAASSTSTPVPCLPEVS